MEEYEHIREPRRSDRAAVLFQDLLLVLEAGGINVEQEAPDLRACMERGWNFEQVERALQRNDKRLKLPGENDRRLVEWAYNTAMRNLDFLYTDLVSTLEKGGFDEAWGGKGLRACLKRGWSFDDLEHTLAASDRALSFPGERDRDLAWTCYSAALLHRRPGRSESHAGRW